MKNDIDNLYNKHHSTRSHCHRANLHPQNPLVRDQLAQEESRCPCFQLEAPELQLHGAGSQLGAQDLPLSSWEEIPPGGANGMETSYSFRYLLILILIFNSSLYLKNPFWTSSNRYGYPKLFQHPQPQSQWCPLPDKVGPLAHTEESPWCPQHRDLRVPNQKGG